MKWSITTPPADRVVSYAEAKYHCNLSETGDTDADAALQTYVEGLIDAATEYAEEATESSLAPRTLTAIFNEGEEIILPRGPLLSITSITDDDDDEITDYEIERRGLSDRLIIDADFSYPLTVVFEAGYEDTGTGTSGVPAMIRHAILCHVGTLYENRESASTDALKAVPHQLADSYRLRRRGLGMA